MAIGHATYQQLKQHLDRQGRTLTEFAAALGTGITQVNHAVVGYAGSDRIPRNPITRKILAAVEEELSQATGHLTGKSA